MADWLIAHGSDGLVVCGSTGEAATMTLEERLELFRVVLERVNKRVPVVVGAGSNCTADTVKMVKLAEEAGVDGVLIVGPYYNKPTQEGFYQHFAAVAKATKLPVIVYNVPGRTGSNIAPATVARLAKDFANIVAIKEAAGNVGQVNELFTLLPEDFTITAATISKFCRLCPSVQPALSACLATAAAKCCRRLCRLTKTAA